MLTNVKPRHLHLVVHFYHNESHIESALQCQKKAPAFRINCKKLWGIHYRERETGEWNPYQMHGSSCTLISSLVTPLSKLETYNFVPFSNPGKPAALRLSSNKSRCQGKLVGLRKDWRSIPNINICCGEQLSALPYIKANHSSRIYQISWYEEWNHNGLISKRRRIQILRAIELQVRIVDGVEDKSTAYELVLCYRWEL